MNNKFPKEVIDALQKSDPRAFETVFSSESRNVKNFIAGLISSEDEAQELAQDVFILGGKREDIKCRITSSLLLQNAYSSINS